MVATVSGGEDKLNWGPRSQGDCSMVEICESNLHGRLSIDRLADFETSLGTRLPDDYRRYLLAHNGGVPTPNSFRLPDGGGSSVSSMYGLHDGPDHTRLDLVRGDYADRIPVWLLPIGNDPGGNELCIDLSEPGRGRIFFWDHETGELQIVAESFAAFIEGHLFEWIDPNEHVFERILRTNNLADVDRIIANGADIESTDNYGRTLLENAAIWGNKTVVERLYRAGAQLREARSYADRNGYPQLVKWIDSLA